MPQVHGLAPHDGLNFSKKSQANAPLESTAFMKQLEKSVGGAGLEAQPALRPMRVEDWIAPLRAAVMPMQPLNPPAAELKPLGNSPFDLSNAPEPKSQHEKLQETARKLVAQTFYGPMLKAMRESPFKDKLMSGGRGGEAFTSMLDQRLAEHMARSSDSKLVRSIARRLERNAARQGAVAPKPGAQDENPNQNVRIHVAPGLRA
jgi:hypothetical protein